MTKQSNEKLLTANEVAELLGVSLSKIRYLVFHKEIPHFKIGQHVRFSPLEINQYIEQCKVKKEL